MIFARWRASHLKIQDGKSPLTMRSTRGNLHPGKRVLEGSMSLLRSILLAIWFIGALALQALAAGPFGSIHVGHWSGGAYTNDKTGAFSHCAAATGYGSGVAVFIGLNAAGNWLVGFGSEKFSLQPLETFPIDVTFDGQVQFHLFGTVDTPKLVTAPLPTNTAVEQLRKSHLMAAVIKGASFQFNLDSTGKLLPVIANCAAKIKAGGLASAGDFSVIPPPKPGAPKPVVQSAAAPPMASPKPTPKPIEINGSGFVISTDGHVLTNHHVVNNCVGDINANLSGQSATTLRVVSKDETNDLALLQASSSFKEIAAIRATATRPGEAVIAIGYPYHGLLTSDFTVTTGIVSSLSGLLNDTRYLQISAAVQSGNSGGPLLDSSGNVVGVVAEKLATLKFVKVTGEIPENINFAIKTGAVRDFLDNSVVSYQTVESKIELKTADIARNARAYTMLISCMGKEKD
jgi:S1-C subfamily serine protease